MIRLFVSDVLQQDKNVALTDNQVHYLMHVMRQKEGNLVRVFNGKNGEWEAVIKTLSKKNGEIIPVKQIKCQPISKTIILCPALIKKENMDFVLQKAVELGVSHIYPLITRRTVVNKFNKERANLILREAAEQCERLSVPELSNPVRLKDLLSVLPENTCVVCLAERMENTKKIQRQEPIAFCVGPEGGWDKDELKWMTMQPQITFCHLGQEILRAETASVAVLSAFNFNVFVD